MQEGREKKYKIYRKLLFTFWFVSIPVSAFFITQIIISLQRLFFAGREEIFLSSSSVFFPAFMLALFSVPYCLYYLIVPRRFSDFFKKDLEKDGYNQKILKRVFIFFLIYTLFFLGMSVFMLRSYTRIQENQVIISKSSLFNNEKTYQTLNSIIKTVLQIFSCYLLHVYAK